MLSMFLVIVAVLAVVLAYKMGVKSGEAQGWETYNTNLRCLTEERNIANRRIKELLHAQALNEGTAPTITHKWLGDLSAQPKITELREKIAAAKSSGRTPPPPRPRIPMSNFGGGHTTHTTRHTHHDHLPGVVLGMAIHDALASSGDGCVVVPDYTSGPTQQGSSDINLTEHNSCVDSTPAYEAPSYSAPSYEPPSCSSSTDYSSGSTDYGCSDTSSSSSSFGD